MESRQSPKSFLRIILRVAALKIIRKLKQKIIRNRRLEGFDNFRNQFSYNFEQSDKEKHMAWHNIGSLRSKL